jgi:hypothetical protein
MSTRITLFTTALTDIDTNPQEPLGTIREDVEKCFKYVKFTGTTAVAIGDFTSYILSDLLTHTVDQLATLVGAGVAVAVHPVGSITYGWIQIKGTCIMGQAWTATAGVPMTMAATGAIAPVGAGASETAMVIAYAYDQTSKTVKLVCAE